MTSICSNLIAGIKRKYEDITNTKPEEEMVSEKNIMYWKNAVDKKNSMNNLFITVHGNTNESCLASKYYNDTQKNSNATDDFLYTVPKGVIIVDLAWDNNVIYSNPIMDMEMAVFKSIPNWITTPTFKEENKEIDLNKPNFNDKKLINTKDYILDNDNPSFAKFIKIFDELLKSKIGTQDTNETSIVNTVKCRQCIKTAENKIKSCKPLNTINDYRQAAVELAECEFENYDFYKISIDLVEEIDKYVMKEEYGLHENDLYVFNEKHDNFDPQGPNMVMHATHIYFTGDKIHNKIMEWEENSDDFNIFKMPDIRAIDNDKIDKKTIHDEIIKKNTNDANGQLEIVEGFYLNNTIKEYPSQKVEIGVETKQLLKIHEKKNKNSMPKNDEPFTLQTLIEYINPNQAEQPIIVYLNSCSPTVRNKFNIEETDNLKRKRRKIRRNIKKESISVDNFYERLKTETLELDKSLSNFLTKINIKKDNLYEIGRRNFINLRDKLINGPKKFTEYKSRNTDDLPRLHKTIVMMGKMEREEWYKNVMGAFFQQLKKEPTPLHDYTVIEQNGMEVLYNQAKRDIFDRILFNLYKNWKSYVNQNPQQNWPEIQWPGIKQQEIEEFESLINNKKKQEEKWPHREKHILYGGRKKKKTRKRRKKRRRKKTRRKRKKRRRKKTRKRRRRTRRKR
jgi:hypothetical protein